MREAGRGDGRNHDHGFTSLTPSFPVQVRELVSQFGDVVDLSLVRDPATGDFTVARGDGDTEMGMS